MSKPNVNARCVAGRYAGPNERIIEISGRHSAGALISIVENDDGLNVYVYRRERCKVAFEPNEQAQSEQVET
jgi:hypothetical protein